MIYRVLGMMSGSSLDGLDIAFVELHEDAGRWTYEIVHADCISYTQEWKERLRNATALAANDYLLLHTEYGRWLGEAAKRFIQTYSLDYRVQFIASHGHTSFHDPARRMTHQLGDGAALAAEVELPVITDLRALDLALGGQGAPIVPIAERLLLPGFNFYLNLGGIANISGERAGKYVAFDVCPANRVLDMLAARLGEDYDEGGRWSMQGELLPALLDQLNALEYYTLPPPKSLANSFGTETVWHIIESFSANNATTPDLLRTCTEHIGIQIGQAVNLLTVSDTPKLLVTGGGAFNEFLIQRIAEALEPLQVEVVVPDKQLVAYKEALAMALIGVLRWREETNVLSSVTGAARDNVGGAIWRG